MFLRYPIHSNNIYWKQEASDIYQLVDDFLATDKGKEYLKEIMNFRCQEEDSTLRFSQTLSIFTHSSKQPPSLSHPTFGMEQNRTTVQSPVRTHIDDTRSSSIGILTSNPLSPPRPEDIMKSIDGIHEGRSLIEEPISALYLGVHESIVWTVVNGLSEPALILTGQPPFFILKGSVDWHALMGYTPEDIFGKCLEHFIPSDSLLSNPYLSQIRKSAIHHRDSEIGFSPSLDEDLTTYDALMSFYRQLQYTSNADIHYRHIVLSLRASDQRVVPFSVHALPLYRRQERRLGSDSVNGVSAELKSIVGSSSHFSLDGPSTNDNLRSPTVAYYVLYMNHLTYIQQDQTHLSDEIENERSPSLVDRAISIASSFSGIGKSLFNTNSEKNVDTHNQLPGPPPNLESESEDDTWGRYSL